MEAIIAAALLKKAAAIAMTFDDSLVDGNTLGLFIRR